MTSNGLYSRIPTVKLKIPVFHNFFMVVDLLSPNRCHGYLNVTEVRDLDFKNAFLGIFNFTVGILD